MAGHDTGGAVHLLQGGWVLCDARVVTRPRGARRDGEIQCESLPSGVSYYWTTLKNNPEFMVDFLIFLPHTMPFSVALLTIHFTLGWILLLNVSLLQRQVRFPQISELAVGPAAAKMLYRRGSEGIWWCWGLDWDAELSGFTILKYTMIYTCVHDVLYSPTG